MTFPKKTVKTARLTLSPLEESDLEDLIDILANENVSKTYMICDLYTDADRKKLYDRLCRFIADSESILYGIRKNGALIGFIHDMEIDRDSIEMGYVLSFEHWNNGYMTEAFKAMIKILFECGFGSVIAGYFEENTASMRVMEKCGMSPMGKTEDVEYRGAVHKVFYREIRK